MASATIAGALESVLGQKYEMSGHRHMHVSPDPGGSDQTFHKDSQRGKPPLHLPRACFIFYYPAGVTDGMGPTELVQIRAANSRGGQGAARPPWPVDSDPRSVGLRAI